MPFVEGETLRHPLDREKLLPVDEAVRLAVGVASALEYAHQHGVIHRDLKPENILLQARQPVIADFGIALGVSNAGGSRVTQTGLSLGTPQYMSREQATGDRAIEGRTDVYSLGAVLYEMLAGEPPHSGTSAQAIIAKLMTTAPQPVRSLRPAVPANVAMAVEKALAKLPADRFGSAHELAEALTNPAFTFSIYARQISAPPVARRRVEITLGVLAAVSLAAALWGWVRPAPPNQVLRYTLTLDSTEALSSQAETGRNELYVVPFPNTAASRWIVSTHGANEPIWSHMGGELFYPDVDGMFQSVAVKTSPTFSVGRPTPLFSASQFYFEESQLPQTPSRRTTSAFCSFDRPANRRRTGSPLSRTGLKS